MDKFAYEDIKIEETKAWWQSRTVWSAIVTIICLALAVFGVEVSETEKGTLIDSAVTLAGGVGILISSGATIYYRIKSDKKIS